MLDLWDYPPFPYLEIIAQHYPQAVWLYLQLWKKRGKNNDIKIIKSEIANHYLISPTIFIRDLRYIARENLLNFFESESELCIELVNWEEINDE